MRATYALHLLGLNALVIARPYFEPFEDDPAALVRHGATPGLILVFALIVLLAPPAVMVALECAAGLVSARLARAMHLVFVAAFVALSSSTSDARRRYPARSRPWPRCCWRRSPRPPCCARAWCAPGSASSARRRSSS